MNDIAHVNEFVAKVGPRVTGVDSSVENASFNFKNDSSYKAIDPLKLTTEANLSLRLSLSVSETKEVEQELLVVAEHFLKLLKLTGITSLKDVDVTLDPGTKIPNELRISTAKHQDQVTLLADQLREALVKSVSSIDSPKPVL